MPAAHFGVLYYGPPTIFSTITGLQSIGSTFSRGLLTLLLVSEIPRVHPLGQHLYHFVWMNSSISCEILSLVDSTIDFLLTLASRKTTPWAGLLQTMIGETW